MITHINIVYLCGDLVALIRKKEQFGGHGSNEAYT